MRFLLIVLLVLVAKKVDCQESNFSAELSDLQLVIDEAPSEYTKFLAAVDLCQFHISHLVMDGISDVMDQMTTHVDTSDQFQHIIYLGLKGDIYYIQEDLELADENYQKALELADQLNNDYLFYGVYLRMGQLYGRQAKLYLSNSVYFTCLQYFESIDDLETVSTIYNDIGYNYSQYGEHEMAIVYLEKCREVGLQLSDPDLISSADINAGYSYEELGDFDQALKKYHESLIMHKELGVQTWVAYSYVLLGTVHVKSGNLDSARYYLDLTEKTLEPEDDYGLSFLYYGNSLYYEAKGDLKRSEVEALKAISTANRSVMPENTIRAMNQLRRVYASERKFDLAYHTYEDYITLRDSLKNPLNSREIAGLEYKYEYENKQIADSLKFAEENRVAAIQHQEELKRYWSYGIAGLFIFGILIVLLYIILKSARQRKIANYELIEKNEKINLQKDKIEKAHRELESKNEEILDSINYARRIQNAILPPLKVVKEYLNDSFILYKPKDIVAGDFYWLEQKDGHILFAAADCTGHGVPGAMVSVICNNGLNRAVRENGLTDPGEILDMTRQIVMQEFEKSEEEVNDGMDIALVSLTHRNRWENENDDKTATHSASEAVSHSASHSVSHSLSHSASHSVLKYAGAHNPLWIVRKGADDIEEIRANKQPIGKFEHNEPYTTHTVDLSKGDTIYIFTDGYADQFGGAEGKKFKSANFKKLILSIQSQPFSEHYKLLDEAFENWKGQLEQLDDVCVIGVRI